MEQDKFSVDEARRRVLSVLSERWPNASFRVRDEATLAREFGWVFTLEVDKADKKTSLTGDAALPRLAVLNKKSVQVFSTSQAYSPEQFAKVFEVLLVENRNWCLTMEVGLGRKGVSIAEAARAAGLEEL